MGIHRHLTLFVLFIAAGCSGSSGGAAQPSPEGDASPPSDGGDDGVSDGAPTIDGGGDAVDAPPDAPSSDDDVPFATKRAACAFKAGAKPSDTFGASIAGAKIPIDTIVIVSQENRSFDHYFSALPAAGQPDVEVPKASTTIPDPAGKPLSPYHSSDVCFDDTAHGWNAMHKDYDGGKNDGFARENANTADPTGHRILGFFDQSDIPFYYGLATTFGISDHHFAPTLTQTGPNRFYLYGATSWGSVSNSVGPPAGALTIFARMTAAGVTWKGYSGATSGYTFEHAIFPSLPAANFKLMADFEADAAAGTLPSVSFVYAGSDEHPPSDMQKGEVAVQRVFDALKKSPQWAHAAFILTYDEGGGLYDHVPPPSACVPDDVAPKLVAGDLPGAFDRYGFRVPLLVASPWSKPHFVSHVVTDHTAILRFLELRFDLPAMTARDANSTALLDFFDFSTPHFSTPPKLPVASVDAAKATASGCK